MNVNECKRLIMLIRLALVAVMLTCAIVLISACKHEHDYTSEVTVQPTCTQAGEVTYKCTQCSNSYTEKLPITSHNYAYQTTDVEHWQACRDCSTETPREKHSHTIVQSVVPATCVSTGIKIKVCVCGDAILETLPVEDHSYTVKQSNADFHWLKCANCSATADEKAHVFGSPTSVNPSTCTTHGSQTVSCECGVSKTETLPLTEHSFTKTAYDTEGHWIVCATCENAKPNQSKTAHSLSEPVVTAEPSCDTNGSKNISCSDCDYKIVQNINALGHDLDRSKCSLPSTSAEHYYKCNRCGSNVAEQHKFVNCDCPEENGGNRAATCYGTGHQAEICELCNDVYCRQIPATNEHDFDDEWIANDTHHWHACQNGNGQCSAHGDEERHDWISKRVNPTCTDEGSEWSECDVCGKRQSGSTVTIDNLGHKLEYHPKKEMTETEAGNRNYWQCTVCKKYFSSSDCHEELFEADIFTYPAKVIEISKIDDFIAIAKQQDSETYSEDTYLVTGWIFETNYDSRIITLVDDESDTMDFTVAIPENVYIYNLHDYDVVTVKGKLFVLKIDDEMVFCFEECEILSVQNSSDKYDVYVETVGLDYKADLTIMYGDDYFSCDTVYFNALSPSLDDKLVIKCTKYNSNTSLYLVRLTVNGVPTTMDNGRLEMIVADDVHIVMEFSVKSPITSVTINKVDTSNGAGNDVELDNYVRYVYQGGANDDGRLYQGSKLTFTVDGAVIVGINITYEGDWLSDYPEELANKIVLKINGHGDAEISQGEASARNKVVLSFELSKGYNELIYYADAHQARITEITLLYQTGNTLATY